LQYYTETNVKIIVLLISCVDKKVKMKFRTGLIFLTFLFIGQSFGQDFKASSVLKSGDWYKVKLKESGIYKLSYSYLKDLGFAAPEDIRVYGQRGKQLSYVNQESIPDDLEEIPLYSSDNGNFTSDDYYLLYAEGVETITFDETNQKFKQEINDYSLFTYLYITESLGSGKRIQFVDQSGLTVNYSSDTYDWIDYYEEELFNVINSGRQWFGEKMDGNIMSKNFSIPNHIAGNPVDVETSMLVRSDVSRNIAQTINGEFVANQFFAYVDINNTEATYGSLRVSQVNYTPETPDLQITYSYSGGGFTDEVYLDYITLNARNRLEISVDGFRFRDKNSVGTGNVTRFSLSHASSDNRVWNITNPVAPFQYEQNLEGDVLSFIAETEELQEFIAVNIKGNFPSPVSTDEDAGDTGWIENQNIHGESTPTMIIVTHPVFLSQAKELAQFRRDMDNFSVLTITTTQVYNEFSSGRAEAAAIRNMARMFYERSNSLDSLKYLLLFGDGSYDNRTLDKNNPNYIPTYQSSSSVSPTTSFVTDDFYALLEVGDGHNLGTHNIGVGRLPVNAIDVDVSQAINMVNKIKSYYNFDNSLSWDWRNNIVFLSDDGEEGWNTRFMVDTEKLCKVVSEKAPEKNINKIFLDAFQQISSSTGASYPEAEEAARNAFNKGALVFNYMGHGGENGITQEGVFTKGDFAALSNAPNFPLFITASCQVSRFDNVEISNGKFGRKESAGETALLNMQGGAIALLSTTRLVFQGSNYQLSDNVFKVMFNKDASGRPYRLGDIFKHAKNNTSKTSASPTNTAKFSLLGDPSLRLAVGEYKIITDSILGNVAGASSDTLNALTEVTFSGYIALQDSTIIDGFNGTVFVNVYDKPYSIMTNGNDGIPQMEVTLQDRLLFRGKASVIDGRFKVSFKVPKDISYNYGQGKVSYYAINEYMDAAGSFSDFILGGTSPDPEPDNEGPEISLFMNDESFVDGGITNDSPTLIAHIYDTNGINTTGNGIGHDLVGTLDSDLAKSYLLNDYFSGDLDNYRRGKLSFPLSGLEEGYHTMDLKVWDTYNNSSTATIRFHVATSNSLVLREVYSFPNPASTSTTFQYAHNQPNSEHKISIDIYDNSGRLVKRLFRTNFESGFISEPFTWNFGSEGRLINHGVYSYRIKVNTSNGFEGIESGSLIIIP
jgi:hypothetical protein